MNTFNNSFVTQFFVCLLIAGIATLAAPMAVQAAPVHLGKVEIISQGTQSGNSYYSFARQRLIGDWYATESPETTYVLRNRDGNTPNKALLMDGNQNHPDGPYLMEPGFSPVATLGAGQPVKFFKAGDTIYFKMSFFTSTDFDNALAVEVIGMPKFKLDFDGKVTNDRVAVYDSTHPANSVFNHPVSARQGNGGTVVFKYVVQPGDECVGDGINFAKDQKYYAPNTVDVEIDPYISTATDRITNNAGSSNNFEIGANRAARGQAHSWLIAFYTRGLSPLPPWPPPRTTAYEHDGLNHLIDAVPANVRITGLIKPETHEEGGVRKNAVDFRTGDFTAESPDVDVTEHDSVTGAFDVEFLFFNYAVGQARGTGVDDTDVIADTTQGFTAADIAITGQGVNRAGWTVSEPDFIGLDHRDPGFPGDIGDPQGRVKHSASFKVYKARITPPADYTGDVRITVPAGATMDIAGNPNLLSNTLTVPVVGVATPDSIATRLGVPTEVTLALPSVEVLSKGFVVLAHSGASVSNTGVNHRFYPIVNLTHLENLFGPNGNGGTLELVDTRVTTTVSKKVGPIITEIMWGSDLSQGDNSKFSQWIEIYNAGAAIADLSVYQLKVTPFSPDTFSADPNAVDTVGNLGNGKWPVPGQGGRTVAVEATEEMEGADVVPLISMRRKVDFSKAANEVNKNGTLSSSWEASTTPTLNIASNRIATPGARPATQITAANRTSIPYSPVIINEIGHSDNPDHIWIELRNVSTGEANLKNWQLSIITADRKEHRVMHFPNNKGDYKLGAGKVLLLVNKDPLTTPLARGKKFGDSEGMTAAADQEKSGLQTDSMFYDAKGTIVLPHAGLSTLPGNGKFLLVLRSEPKTNHEKIVDISGELFLTDEERKTSIWPLYATPAGNSNVINGDLAKGRVYKRNKAGEGFGEKVWDYANYPGVGYDRSAGATNANGGTPGFPNDALKAKPGDLASGAVTISEIMVVSDNGRYPQWIELRNSSPSQGINLNDWHLRIENVGTDVDSRQNVTINLPDDYIIGPNQTILIATRRGSAPQPLNSQRVMLLWNDSESGGARQALEVDNSRFTMLSMKGFTLELFGKDVALSGTPTDTVTIGAALLTADKIGNSEQRISLIRGYNGGVATDNWVSAKGSWQLTEIPSDTYYGIADDVGTPGYYPGTALPVSLSSFLPKRTDAGVVIKWTTQSELNNAGFNILRSATKTGAFVVINPTMIQGAGTTGEKHTYSYTDKTAKPNIVYYYQIEDVSFDGHRQRLTGATRLRGHIGAAGKLPTTWGDLKIQE